MTVLKQIITPIISLIIMTLGSALLTTFLSLKLHSLGISNFIIGGLSTAYYGGMVVGAFKLETIILRVGHIRAYSACAAMLAVASMLHGFYINSYFWLVLRFIEGIVTAGLYIVIESWILTVSKSDQRGTSLAYYMVALYLAQSIGQWFLNLGHENTLVLYAISSMLAAISIVPLALTHSDFPSFAEPETFSIQKMFHMSPSGVVTCFASGLILGSLYGLYPTYVENLGYSLSSISTVLGLMIFGGMLFQYPIGRLSDRLSRRYIIAVLSFITVGLCCFLYMNHHLPLWMLCLLSFFLGGCVFCLYPLGISHTCDVIDNNQVVAATQTLLFAYGIGATSGPLIAPLGMLAFGHSGLLAYVVMVSFPLGIYILWRKQRAPLLNKDDKQGFALGAEMTPVAAALDPRSEKETG